MRVILVRKIKRNNFKFRLERYNMSNLNTDDLINDSNKRNDAIIGLKEAIEYEKALDNIINNTLNLIEKKQEIIAIRVSKTAFVDYKDILIEEYFNMIESDLIPTRIIKKALNFADRLSNIYKILSVKLKNGLSKDDTELIEYLNLIKLVETELRTNIK